MKFNIIFLKTEKGFSKKEKVKIKNIIKNAARHAIKILNLRNIPIINFTVYPFSGIFSHGATATEDLIYLYVKNKKFNEDDLKGTVYHEMHHIARYFTYFTKRKISFLDALFSEGLAVVFEIEQIPRRIPPHSRYTEGFIKKWLPQLKKEKLMNSDFSHDEWFWGKKKKPYWLGYKIGTYLVNQIKKNYPNLTAAKLVKRRDKDLLKLSGVKLI